jgi:ProP effector
MSQHHQQKHECKQRRNTALNWLTERFPEAFHCQNRIRPLKIGILHDVLSFSDEAHRLGISKSKLREALVLFTRKVDYLACLKAKEMRIDLYGNPTARVTDEEAQQARAKLIARAKKTQRFHQNQGPQTLSKKNRAPQQKQIIQHLKKKLSLIS